MSKIRELYFKYKEQQTTYLTENVIRSLLIKVNNIDDSNKFFLCLDEECKNEELLIEMIKKVKNGIPYQYVINSSIFNQLDFYVDERVLIPRNETEELVLKTINLIEKTHRKVKNILDICTGSGCIAISLAKQFKDAKVVATDISESALEVARINNERLNTKVELIRGNLMYPLLNRGDKFDLIISNPPYIKSEETVDPMVLKYEPHLALFANPNTKYYHEIILSIPYILNDNGIAVFEIEDDMEDKLESIIKAVLPSSNYKFEKDMYGHQRFLFIEYMKEKKDLLEDPIRILRQGGVVCFPTETVMGLGIVFDNYDSYQRLNEIKNRPNDKPYTLMLDDWKKVGKYAHISILFEKLLEKCGEYPMTFLLKKKDVVPDYVTHGTDVIGVRVPNHAQICKLIEGVGKPLLVPSANKSGEKPALSSSEAKDIFNDEVDYYIEGSAIGGKPSTIIDLTSGEIKIIREGDLTLDIIKRRLEE